MTTHKKISFWYIAAAAFVIALIGGFSAIKFTMESNQNPPQARSEIGGPFRLSSPAENIVTDGTFIGRWRLMYFGATRCVDNKCSKTLKNLAQAMEILGNKTTHVATLFISMDNNYDTASRLRLFIKQYGDKIIALTGGDLAIRDLSILYHVPIVKIKQANGTDLIQPYNRILIMSPEGNYSGFLNADTSAQEIAERMSGLISESEK